MKRFFTFAALAALLACGGCGSRRAGQTSDETLETTDNMATLYPVDTLDSRDARPFRITFFKHASLALEIEGRRLYIDPVGEYADCAALPKADLILVSHHHGDHFDPEAVAQLMQEGTQILCDRTTAGLLAERGVAATVLRPGGEAVPFEGLVVTGVAAYNVSPGREGFHPASREDLGFLLTYGGTRLYVAGDSEPTPEMKALRDIDIALLPVNQPYTMTVDQAVGVVRTLRPRIFYPYHYGQVDEVTDLARLQQELEGVTEVRIRDME